MNGYVSFKEVKRLPNDGELLLEGQTSSGWSWALGLGNEMYPHLYVTAFAPGSSEPASLGISIETLVTSVLGGFASDTDIWEPLTKSPQEGHRGAELWGNSQLTVSVHRHDEEHIELSYHRRDRAPIRDWRIGQRVKNEICGPEWEGVELYPAESRLLDEANEYHIFCTPHPWPMGQTTRTVMTQADHDSEGLPAVQRDPDEETPCVTASPSATVQS